MSELDRAYAVICSHEEQFAFRLGQEVIDKPVVSVWMILLPVLFVHHMQKVSSYKNAVQAFARGMLEPRQKALDKARQDVASGESRDWGLQDAFPSLEGASERDRRLADKQLQVMRILQDHYRHLLKADQESYPNLLKAVYPDRAQYKAFLDRLTAAEQELNRYLTEKVHTTEDSRVVVQRMEASCKDLRRKELDRFSASLDAE